MARTRSKRSSGKGSPDALASRLESLFAAVVAQVQVDPKFATRVEAALNAGAPAASATPSTRKPAARSAPAPPAEPPPPPPPRHKPAVLDPFAVYESGWEVMLQQRLERLSVRQLGDVIHQYKLDPHERMSDEKNAERLRDWILKAVLKKAGKV